MLNIHVVPTVMAFTWLALSFRLFMRFPESSMFSRCADLREVCPSLWWTCFSVRLPLLSADARPCPVRGLWLSDAPWWRVSSHQSHGRKKCPKSFSCDGSCKLLIHTVTNFKAVLLWMFQLITLCCLRNNPSTLQALFITCGDQSLPSHIVLGSRLCYRKQEMIVQNLRAASESHVKAKSQHSECLDAS